MLITLLLAALLIAGGWLLVDAGARVARAFARQHEASGLTRALSGRRYGTPPSVEDVDPVSAGVSRRSAASAERSPLVGVPRVWTGDARLDDGDAPPGAHPAPPACVSCAATLTGAGDQAVADVRARLTAWQDRRAIRHYQRERRRARQPFPRI